MADSNSEGPSAGAEIKPRVRAYLEKLSDSERFEVADHYGHRVTYGLIRQTGDVEGALDVLAGIVIDREA